MAGLIVNTEPAQEPVTLQEVKEYLKTGKPIPKHISDKRIDLMNKLGEYL